MRRLRGLDEAQRALQRRPQDLLSITSPELEERSRTVFGQPLTPLQAVQRILDDVRQRGDDALRHYTRAFDGVELGPLEVSREELRAAYSQVPKDLVEALQLAAGRVREFHEACMRRTWVDHREGWGELVTPLERVGVYVPGGTAPYPSTVLMTALPARVAGVDEVVVTTPPRAGTAPDPSVLVACDIAGVDRVFRVGGAQAVAALAYGTTSVPQVDLVCGPGNLFVTIAKKLLHGAVAIDGLYGPSETVLIADESADPALCAADLLAQAEHDALASPIFITTSEAVASRVEEELNRRLQALERRDIAAQALEGQGCLVTVDTLEEAFQLANGYAPEHLCLLLRDAWAHLDKVRHAGGVFLGEGSPEVAGDYVAGPSHQMPTGGTARFSSVLGVHHFLKVTSIVGLDAETYTRIAWAGARIARAEGLTAHAQALEARLGAVRSDPSTSSG